MVCGINWTLLKVAHSYRLSKSISAKSVRLVSVLHRCCCWNSSSFDWCGERWKLLKKTTKRGLVETGMKYFPGRHRTTAANSGTMQYHATVEGPQNWALVWGPGSRAPESKVLENSNTMQLWRSTSELSNSLRYSQRWWLKNLIWIAQCKRNHILFGYWNKVTLGPTYSPFSKLLPYSNLRDFWSLKHLIVTNKRTKTKRTKKKEWSQRLVTFETLVTFLTNENNIHCLN